MENFRKGLKRSNPGLLTTVETQLYDDIPGITMSGQKLQ